jgi:hypothetical protein
VDRGRPREAGAPADWAALLDHAECGLQAQRTEGRAGDGFLFSGNRQTSVPLALFLDRRLTPLERNAWQVFRLKLNDDGITAFPTYEELRPYLASTPCTSKASHETVARALALLRLTRWLSLVRRRRDAGTGRIQGNVYVLHDEPLTPFEAMQLDPDYLGLVGQALTHASKAVQVVGLHTLQEIADDRLLAGRALPSRLQVLAHRLAHRTTRDDTGVSTEPMREPEGSDEVRLSPLQQSSDSEVGVEAARANVLRNPKQDSTVRTNAINNVRTVPPESRESPLRLPPRFRALRQEQQSGALVALQQVDHVLRQTVLDEWAARCHAGTIRNPAAYLFGVIQKAIKGEFHAWAAQPTGARAGKARPRSTGAIDADGSPTTDPRTARQHLTQLREILKKL